MTSHVTQSVQPVVPVTVLLATYNGMRFLAEQIDSIEAQTYPRVNLIVSDDGSTDGTVEYVAARVAAWSKGEAVQLAGPRRGDAFDNFSHLFQHLPASAGYVALSDQDDVWLPHKLESAVANLRDISADIPAAISSRTSLIDGSGNLIGQSMLFERPPSFRNALMQNLGGGNTMVLNAAAAALVRQTIVRIKRSSHDLWVYRIVTGAGGIYRHRQDVDTLYRQHGGNVVGDGQGWRYRVGRLGQVFSGQVSSWNSDCFDALTACDDVLTPDARELLQLFRRMSTGGFFARLHALHKGRFYRQTPLAQVMLWISCALGRF